MNLVALVPLLSGLLDKLIPDQQAAADAKLNLLDLAQRGELAVLDADKAIALAQIDVNKSDAQGNTMQKGWRPFIGWVCGVALAWDTIGKPVLVFAAAYFGHPLPALPTLSTDQLYGLLFGLLGLGGFRTYEKIKGAA